MSEENGIICAYALTGAGRADAVSDWNGIASWWDAPEPLWLHLHLDNAEAQRWLENKSGFDAVVGAALQAEEPRPRFEPCGNGMIVALRGVNLNPGADPEDMVSVRLWVDERRIVSVRRRQLMAIRDIVDEIESGAAPATTGEFIALLADRLVSRMGPVLANLDEQVDELEDTLLTAPNREVRAKLGAIRRQAIALRRYIGPQREALARLSQHAPAWINSEDRHRLREVADHITRYVEDLDSIRERAAVMQDEIGNRMSEQTNRNMYLLSLVAAVFLPLSFITGLLGVNVGGVPGTSAPWAFLALCAILAVIGAFEIWLVRTMKWF